MNTAASFLCLTYTIVYRTVTSLSCLATDCDDSNVQILSLPDDDNGLMCEVRLPADL